MWSSMWLLFQSAEASSTSYLSAFCTPIYSWVLPHSRYVMPSFFCYRRIMTRHIGVTKTYTISVNFLLSKWEKGIGIMGPWPLEVTTKFEKNITTSLISVMTPNAWRTEWKIARQCTSSGWSLIKTQGWAENLMVQLMHRLNGGPTTQRYLLLWFHLDHALGSLWCDLIICVLHLCISGTSRVQEISVGQSCLLAPSNRNVPRCDSRWVIFMHPWTASMWCCRGWRGWGFWGCCLESCRKWCRCVWEQSNE